jgi:TRAP-type C4-dicarboxylate transport system permease small subunit
MRRYLTIRSYSNCETTGITAEALFRGQASSACVKLRLQKGSPVIIRRAGHKVLEIAASAAIMLILLMPVAVAADVISRNFFGQPLPVIFEATEYAMLWIPLLVAPLVTLHNEHIVVDLIDNVLSENHGARWRRVIDVLGTLFALVVVLLLAVMSWDTLVSSLQTDTRMATVLAPPRWAVHAILPVASTVLVLVYGALLAGYMTMRVRSNASVPAGR